MKKRAKPRERIAGVYELKTGGPLVVRGFSRAVTLANVQWGRHRTVENDITKLGKVVLQVLGECREGVPDRDELTKDDLRFLSEAGTTSYSAFHAKTRSVGIVNDGECMRVVPTDSKPGWHANKSPTIKVALPTTPARLGDAVRRGLNRSTFLGGSKKCMPSVRPTSRKRAGRSSATRPEPFGPKCAWLAIKSPSPSDVVTALGLAHSKRTMWKDGLATTYKLDLVRRRVFVSPPVDRWIFVVGPMGLPADERTVDLTVRLSAKLKTTVQYFVTHRVVEVHGWVLAMNGKLVRAYAYSGESGSVLFDRGNPTDFERKLGAKRLAAPHEEDVLSIAGAWGISPMTLGDIDQGGEGYGQLGEMPSPR